MSSLEFHLVTGILFHSSAEWLEVSVFSYREASVEVIEVMSRFAVIERASIDEAYMDLTSSVQKRLKDLRADQIDPHNLKTTYAQGFPLDTAELSQTGDVLMDKGTSTSWGWNQFCTVPQNPAHQFQGNSSSMYKKEKQAISYGLSQSTELYKSSNWKSVGG